MPSTRRLVFTLATVGALSASAATAAFALAPSRAAHGARATQGKIVAVGAENEYANVISQIGGRYVAASAIESNPNTDPHTFEASPSIAEAVGSAELVVQNGLGYDTFMNRIEAAASNSKRRVIDVQQLLGLPDSTANPHLWYSPKTMPAVAAAVGRGLSALDPAHAAYFRARVRRFEASLTPWLHALKAFAKRHPSVPVATTEPVADYMLHAAGARIRTPWSLQADIMNGVDPAPQDVSIQNQLLSGHKVKVLLYNQQVTDTLTQTFLSAARSARVPIVGVYETMPIGFSYQSWMLAELHALESAVAGHLSTGKL
jgi:zinc/manganese transport system substrate-binding protein